MKTTDVVLWKRKRTDTEGTINLRVSDGSQRSYKSLGHRINEKHWDESSQRVKRTDVVDYKAINLLITNKLAELIEVETLQDVAHSNDSFLSYCENFIDSITSHGSKTKYVTVFNKFKAFLKSQHKQSLRFDELTPEFIRDLHNYLIKSIERNTANHYMKIYSQMINRAVKERKHTYLVHPFVSTEYKRTAKTREILNIKEINRFRNVLVPERLKRAQNAFFFQLLAQGMRVSDVIRLRWSNIKKEDYLEYTMFKTGKPMSIFINSKLYDILTEIANELPPIKQHPHLIKLGKTLNISYVKAKNSLLADGVEHVGDGVLSSKFTKNKEVADYETDKEVLALNTRIAIAGLANTKYGNDFVFSFLKTKEFPEDVTSINISDTQYKAMHSAKIVYNRQLKEIQKLAKIETTITSHLARHAYTHLMLDDKNGYDVYDISRALGHSSLKTTETYLVSFSKSHVGKINEAISKRFD